nr:universal stress protein [Lactiplantibacillus pentosus]
MYQNILVPLDGSDNAYMALEHAVQLHKPSSPSCTS